jgi:predicted MFS family arabinose efflux permease
MPPKPVQAVDKSLELARRNARRVLAGVSTVAFATSLFSRAIDPIIPPIAGDLGVMPETVALLSTAFSLPFALIQPILGPLADAFGKTRIMTLCLIVLIATAAIGATATTFQVLLASRMLAGIAAGGIFPVSLAIVGDLVPVAERQIALGRYLAVVISGNFLGASLAGAVADLIGWRGVFVAIGCCGAVAFVASRFGFAGQEKRTGARLEIHAIPGLFRAIFGNPRAKICYAAVFLEGVAIFGLFPYVALLLFARGEARASIAGLVLGGFALGGVAYALMVRMLLGKFRPNRLMLGGAAVAALALLGAAFGMPWPAEMAVFGGIGFGFYMLHACIQVQATEIAPGARGAAMALHSFFFFTGQAIGPVFYGFGLLHFGAVPTLALGGAIMLLVGVFTSRLLRERPAPL